jgi:hypothetical protein
MLHARHAVLTTLRLVMCTVEAQVRWREVEGNSAVEAHRRWRVSTQRRGAT